MVEVAIETKHLRFTVRGFAEGQKTKSALVENKHDGCDLGTIRWYGPWRQYCFFSNGDLVLSAGCLTDIERLCTKLNSEQRSRWTPRTVAAAGGAQ